MRSFSLQFPRSHRTCTLEISTRDGLDQTQVWNQDSRHSEIKWGHRGTRGRARVSAQDCRRLASCSCHKRRCRPSLAFPQRVRNVKSLGSLLSLWNLFRQGRMQKPVVHIGFFFIAVILLFGDRILSCFKYLSYSVPATSASGVWYLETWTFVWILITNK